MAVSLEAIMKVGSSFSGLTRVEEVESARATYFLNNPYFLWSKVETELSSRFVRCVSYPGDYEFFQQMPDYIKAFIESERWCLCFALRSSSLESPYGYLFRSCYSRNFRIYSYYNFFGLEFFPETFEYGMPVLLVEGLKDTFPFLGRFPVLCVFGSAVTVNFSVVLFHLTNRYLLGFDKDKAGKSGYFQSKELLEGIGAKVGYVPILEGKDFGTLVDLYFKDQAVYRIRQDSEVRRLERYGR